MAGASSCLAAEWTPDSESDAHWLSETCQCAVDIGYRWLKTGGGWPLVPEACGSNLKASWLPLRRKGHCGMPRCQWQASGIVDSDLGFRVMSFASRAPRRELEGTRPGSQPMTQ